MKSNKIYLSLFMLAFLTIFLVTNAAGSIENNKSDIIENNYVSKGNAYKHANVALDNFIAAGSPSPNGTSWTDATLNKKPLTIYDINGKKLFYEYLVEKDGKCIGTIITSANKVLASPVCSIRFNAPIGDSEELLAEATKLIESQYPNYKIDSTKVVCYSYPKRGLDINIVNAKKDDKKTIFIDAGDYSTLSSKELSNSYSTYDVMSSEEMIKAVDIWNEKDRNIDKYQDSSELSSSAISTRAITSDRISGFNLYGQEYGHYCAPAVGKMIADYYGYSHSQTYVAIKMGTTPQSYTTIPGQLNYYRLTLGKTNSQNYAFYYPWSTNNWLDVKDMITANKPFASVISGHVRACTGWGEFGDRYLYIYDPSPTGSGDIYWEAEGCTITLSNIYVQ